MLIFQSAETMLTKAAHNETISASFASAEGIVLLIRQPAIAFQAQGCPTVRLWLSLLPWLRWWGSTHSKFTSHSNGAQQHPWAKSGQDLRMSGLSNVFINGKRTYPAHIQSKRCGLKVCGEPANLGVGLPATYGGRPRGGWLKPATGAAGWSRLEGHGHHHPAAIPAAAFASSSVRRPKKRPN